MLNSGVVQAVVKKLLEDGKKSEDLKKKKGEEKKVEEKPKKKLKPNQPFIPINDNIFRGF